MGLKLLCSNPECEWSRSHKGGKFIWRGAEPFCEECLRPKAVMNEGENRWSFETMNMGSDPNAGPVKVQSLRHLRQLEAQHGVVSVAANMDHRNWDTGR